MLGRRLAAYGVTVVAWMMPPAMLAQLPDAPSAVRAAEQATAAIDARNAREHDSALHGVLERRWVTAQMTAPPAPAEAGVSSSADPEEIAFLVEGSPEGQQPFAPRYRQRSHSLSSKTSYLGDVPGAAPALQSACPKEICALDPPDMCCGKPVVPFALYLKAPNVVPLTAEDNLRSAVRGVIDPFNLLTIGADAAIGIGSDSHTPYGPGMKGFWQYSGVSLTEDMTGEFFGTFLVPSIMHQDPHYHRQPYMPVKHRLLHAVVQLVWTQSYTGQPMFNYANFVGGIATAVVSNTFVPGPNRQGFGNTAERLALAFAISPTGNLIEEFVPDLASHVNLRVVIFQRILNTVTLEESGVPQ